MTFGATLKIATVAGLVFSLLAVSWFIFLAVPQPALAQPPLKPLQATLAILQTATTSTGGNGTAVDNGQRMIYTLTVSAGSQTANNIIVTNPLAPGVFENIQGCNLPECTVGFISRSFTDRSGQVIQVSRPATVTWNIATIAANQVRQLGFTGRVICQTEGTLFSNQPFANYDGGFAFSNAINTQVRAALPVQDGQFSFSAAPEWCSGSDAPGAVVDMDWGDFDRDGDLDLALVSWELGAVVYRNVGNTLTTFWQYTPAPISSEQVEGVRWADFNDDGDLELLLVGSWDSTDSPFPDNSNPLYGFTGYNSVYELVGGGTVFTPTDTFTTNDGSWRAEVADFSRPGGGGPDGLLDIAMINYWGGCTVHLYRNRNTDALPLGRFNRSDPGGTDSYCLFSPPYGQFSSDSRDAHSAAWGDFDNDGDPDLAVGHLDLAGTASEIRVYRNEAGVLTDTAVTNVLVELDAAPNYRYTFDLAWGDYNNDGFLDLAAGFSSLPRTSFGLDAASGGFRVYRNNSAVSFTEIASQNTTRKVAGVDWADFNGDGKLDLAVGESDAPPRIYGSNSNFTTPIKTLLTTSKGDVYGIRGVDYTNDGDLDLAFSNSTGESFIMTAVAGFLKPQRSAVLPGPFTASGLAWGEVNGGSPDLLFATPSQFASKLQLNNNAGAFTPAPAFSPNPPANTVALANVDGDNDVDLMLGVNGQDLLYLNSGGGTFPSIPNWIETLAFNTSSLFFADVNQDTPGRLDLITGNSNGPNLLYLNPGSLAVNTPAWQSAPAQDTRSVAWGYYDGDILPDFAAANNGQPLQIYRNTGLNTFTLAQTLGASNARSTAWGDYDGDGDMDLVVGNFGQPNQLYQNNGGSLSLVSAFAPPPRNTTSVAWGDWDNDADLDLAVGNQNQPTQVFDNLDSTSASPRLFWVWQSSDAPTTTGVAWGDYDRDGDLDLALSKTDAGANGIYENTYASPTHFGSFLPKMPLPQNPSYLSVAQPGQPNQVFVRSNPALSSSLNVIVNFTFFDTDGPRNVANTAGDRIKVTGLEYSLNGGGKWYAATVTETTPLNNIVTDRDGFSTLVIWRAGRDMQINAPNLAVSDDVRFRVTIARLNQNGPNGRTIGPIQRAFASAISPPFRVRNLSCVWPEGPIIDYTQPVTFGAPVRFSGSIAQYQGDAVATFVWDFGDEVIPAQELDYTFFTNGPHVITLTVTQPGCPVTRPVFTTAIINISGENIYLPLVLKKSGATATSTSTEPETDIPTPAASAVGEPAVVDFNLASGSPTQVAGLIGHPQPEGTILQWAANPPGDNVRGYRVYHSNLSTPSFKLLAELPATTTSYTDNGVTCGQMYYVTAYNDQGGSLPSTSSYLSSTCP